MNVKILEGNHLINKRVVLDSHNIDFLINQLHTKHIDLLIIKNYINDEEKKELLEWSRFLIEKNNDFSYKKPDINGMTIIKDERPPNQSVKGTMLSINIGPKYKLPPLIDSVYRKCILLRKAAIKKSFDFNEDEIKNIKKNIPDLGFPIFSIYFYPLYGGQLDLHSDPPKQSLVGMVNLSKFNDDYDKGGLYILKENKKLHIDSHLSTGDAYLFNQTNKHVVELVDTSKRNISNKSWNTSKGRWVAFARWQTPS